MFGNASKWLIKKSIERWSICPPIKGGLWPAGKVGGRFDTGAEAFAAFAAGGEPMATSVRLNTETVEPYHGKAAVPQ